MHQRHASAGFTIAELLIALGFFVVLSGSAAALFGSATPNIRANSQVNRVLSLLQNGREQAITRQRRHLLVCDQAANTISLFRLEGNAQVLVDQIGFEFGMRFELPSLAPDTPDGYGNGGAIDFDGAANVMFDSEGSFVDDNGLPVNGTMYLGVPGKAVTERAVTITGSTGRARFYLWNGNGAWQGGWLAK